MVGTDKNRKDVSGLLMGEGELSPTNITILSNLSFFVVFREAQKIFF